MHTEVILDRQGDLPAPPGYQVIASEVDFLRYATDDTPLLIRGERLSAWAEAFYSLRGRPYCYRESLRVVLQRTFPALLQQQADKLALKMGMAIASPEQMTATFVLNCCYPDDYALWQGAPSREHAARWLLWLFTHRPDDAETVILHYLATELERRSVNASEAGLYRVFTSEGAKSILWRWLGAADEKLDSLDEFPLPVPEPLLTEIKSAWMKRLIESKGVYFAQMFAFPMSVALRQELAQLAVQFYEQNTPLLTRGILRDLQPYLNTQTLATLEERLPPPEPSALPQDPTAVLAWFEAEYLPYRRWQARFGDEQARTCIVQRAQDFVRWYLSCYPRWLLEPGNLSFQISARLHDAAPQALTLCVVLDGLPAWDAEDFIHTMGAKIERLQLEQKSYCFAPMPTVTEFAKDALLKGVPPRLSPQYPPLGYILPDHTSPKRGLKDIRSGEVVFWRVEQPDKAYHFESEDKREREVHAKLESILQAISEVVQSLPNSVILHIIITSDHGRLLNPKSPRCLPTPKGMQAHGRVAWGKLDLEFDEHGFSIDETAGTIAVHGERFEMAHDMLVAWGEESFENDKAGYDPYPHGGLFPEEVIVPWFVFVRDAKTPALNIVISGKGEAKHVGTITVVIINTSQIILECLGVSFSHGVQVGGNWQIPPLDETRFNLSLTPWPTESDKKNLKATLLFRQPNGTTFSSEVVPHLQVETLYEQPDDLLKELDL